MDKLQSRGHLLTEQINPNSQNLDSISSLEIVDLFNQEDAKTIQAIACAPSSGKSSRPSELLIKAPAPPAIIP